MNLAFKCNSCGNKHTLTDKEFHKLMETDKCSYVCKCGSHIKIVQEDDGFYFS